MADALVVGSGINSLACAALLARGGWSVRVFEREDELGGCIRTAELTEPGYLHDVFSAWHPLWVGGAAHAEPLGELQRVIPDAADRIRGHEDAAALVLSVHGPGARDRPTGADAHPGRR